MTISIVLADDHPVVRRGMRALLEGEADLSVAGEASDGLEAVRLLERLQPDVAVLDLMMPGLSGLEALRIIRQRSPETRVVMLSMYSNNAFIAEALKIGATGYVLKGCSEENLIRAVREAAAGRRFLSPKIASIVADQVAVRPGANPLTGLSKREREILQMVAEGQSSAAIGRALNLSPKTVDTYRSRLMQKLQIKDVAGLVKFAIQQGLIPLE